MNSKISELFGENSCPFIYTVFTRRNPETSNIKRVPYEKTSKRMRSRRYYTSDLFTRESFMKRYKDDPAPPKKRIVDGKVYEIDFVEVITTY